MEITLIYPNQLFDNHPAIKKGRSIYIVRHPSFFSSYRFHKQKILLHYLSTDQYKLYNLIWSRSLSSQMQSAKFDRKTITINSDDDKNIFKASGSTLKFDGFLKLYKIDENDDDNENILPDVVKGDVIFEDHIDEQHYTQPPPRYSEASLVKKLEELGIGRPSTYASIISVIANRGYADINNKRFFPTDRGKLLSAFLEKLFTKYVDYDFTAKLEDQLDLSLIHIS